MFNSRPDICHEQRAEIRFLYDRFPDAARVGRKTAARNRASRCQGVVTTIAEHIFEPDRR
jgi:hypothetical protein